MAFLLHGKKSKLLTARIPNIARYHKKQAYIFVLCIIIKGNNVGVFSISVFYYTIK
jgi:hypothetical protein